MDTPRTIARITVRPDNTRVVHIYSRDGIYLTEFTCGDASEVNTVIGACNATVKGAPMHLRAA